jgi:hypothetical protein
VCSITNSCSRSKGTGKLGRKGSLKMSNDSGNNRINNLFERLAIALLGILFTILFTAYQYQRTDFKALEEKVLVVQINKVNKEDLKDVESRLNTKMDAMSSSLSQEVRNIKSDILDRINDIAAKNKK